MLFAGDPGAPWFAGVVAAHLPSGLHKINFDDGDVRRIDIAEHLEEDILRWVTPEVTAQVKRDGAGDETKSGAAPPKRARTRAPTVVPKGEKAEEASP